MAGQPKHHHFAVCKLYQGLIDWVKVLHPTRHKRLPVNSWRVDLLILHSAWRVDHTVVTSWLASFTFAIGLCYRRSVHRLSVICLRLLRLVVIVCRRNGRRPRYKLSITARRVLVFCVSALDVKFSDWSTPLNTPRLTYELYIPVGLSLFA